jgi:hypothetical protein
LPEVLAAFFETFFVFAVFFATPHLLKLRREGYGGHARLYRCVSAWRAGATHRRASSTKAFRSELLAYKMVEQCSILALRLLHSDRVILTQLFCIDRLEHSHAR